MSKHPITDAYMRQLEAAHFPPPPYPIADLARRLEEDRAALVEALDRLLSDASAIHGDDLCDARTVERCREILGRTK